MPTLLDTHAWLWWAAEDRRLSRRAASAIRKAQAQDSLWVSLISVWEIAKKIEKGQLSRRTARALTIGSRSRAAACSRR